jgi:hypothetical protein
MKLSRKTGLILLAIFLIATATSCASGRTTYHPPKKKKPSGCDCSRWSYIIPSGNFLFYAEETKPSGRA